MAWELKKTILKHFKWFVKSAKMGWDDALYMLGRMYCYGEGVDQDYGEALKWYEKSAKKASTIYTSELDTCSSMDWELSRV